MAAHEHSMKELQVKILSKLLRNHRIGHRYANKHDALSKVSRAEWDDGEDAMEQLVQEGLLKEWKNGDCISIDPKAHDDIEELLRGEVPDFFITHYLHQHG